MVSGKRRSVGVEFGRVMKQIPPHSVCRKLLLRAFQGLDGAKGALTAASHVASVLSLANQQEACRFFKSQLLCRNCCS